MTPEQPKRPIDERLGAITGTLAEVTRMLWNNEARIERLLETAAGS